MNLAFSVFNYCRAGQCWANTHAHSIQYKWFYCAKALCYRDIVPSLLPLMSVQTHMIFFFIRTQKEKLRNHHITQIFVTLFWNLNNHIGWKDYLWIKSNELGLVLFYYGCMKNRVMKLPQRVNDGKNVLVMLFWSLFIFLLLFIYFLLKTYHSFTEDTIWYPETLPENTFEPKNSFLLNWLWKYINITKIRRPTIKIKQFGDQSVLFYFSYVPCHLFLLNAKYGDKVRFLQNSELPS